MDNTLVRASRTMTVVVAVVAAVIAGLYLHDGSGTGSLTTAILGGTVVITLVILQFIAEKKFDDMGRGLMRDLPTSEPIVKMDATVIIKGIDKMYTACVYSFSGGLGIKYKDDLPDIRMCQDTDVYDVVFYEYIDEIIMQNTMINIALKDSVVKSFMIESNDKLKLKSLYQTLLADKEKFRKEMNAVKIFAE